MTAALSTPLVSRLAALPDHERIAFLRELPPGAVEGMAFAWPLWARPDQLPPPGDWRTWLLLGGRGAGKTRSSAEWVRDQAESGRRGQIGIIGPTADAVRRVQVEGPSGILAIAPPWCRPTYEPSTRRITWPNGAVAHLFSAEEPDRLRGPNLDAAWGDELTSWPDPRAMLDMLQMAMRLPGLQGDPPQMLISTTPKPIPELKAILADPTTAVTRARTLDNASNLDAATLRFLTHKYGGTTLGRQELDAELITDAAGALWSRAMLEEGRVEAPPKAFRRIVVAIDPAGGNAANNAETGLVVVAEGHDRHCYLLEDLSGRYSPEGWASRAVSAYRVHQADRIVAERNFGGAMVEATIRAVDQNVPVRMVNASRGKAVRAEPVVALYEQHRVHHVGHFPVLEDQLCEWEPGGRAASPDRLDALAWGISDLMMSETSYNSRYEEWL